MRRFTAAALLAISASCVERTPLDVGDGGLLRRSALILSDPVSALSGALGDAGFSSSLVYVSLVPGSVQDGTVAMVANLVEDTVVATPIVNGGFDPVGIPAVAGQIIEVAIRAGGRTLSRTEVEVPPRIRPRVVRTDPPAKKRDVPLNSVIVVVFSEPVDPATVNTGTIRLVHEGAPVAGEVRLISSDGTVATFAPAAPLASGTDYELTIGADVTDLQGDPLESAISVDFSTGSPAAMSRIAFYIPEQGLFVMNADGSGRRQLTWGNVDHSPAWSPDGRRIAFVRDTEINLINADGTGLIHFTRGASPAWSPDGSRIAFVVPDLSQIHVMNVNGGFRYTLTTGQSVSSPSWSPDGSRIVFTRAVMMPIDGVYQYVDVIHDAAANGTGLRQLSNAGESHRGPSVSPDGRRIAFVKDDGTYIMQIDGSDVVKVSALPATSWSPDGTRLVGEGMVIMNADGSQPIRMGDGESPAWSRSGAVPPPPQLLLQRASAPHGDGQVDTVFAQLEPFRVRATLGGAPAAGVRIIWTVLDDWQPGAYGFMTPDTTYTDADGIAGARLTLGGMPDRHLVEARMFAEGHLQFVRFGAEAKPGNPVALSGHEFADVTHVAQLNTMLSLRADALDAHGLSVAGVPLEWTVTAGGGVVVATADTTGNSSELGTADFFLGHDEGMHVAEVTSPRLPAARETFNVRGVSAMVTFQGKLFCYYTNVPQFVPQSVTVEAGRTVGWHVRYEDCADHDITFEDDPAQPASSGTLPASTEWNYHSRTFAVPGVYRYRCSRHSTDFTTGEVGIVTVVDPNP